MMKAPWRLTALISLLLVPASLANGEKKEEVKALTRAEVLGKVKRKSHPEARKLYAKAKPLLKGKKYAEAQPLVEECLARYPASLELIAMVKEGAGKHFFQARDFLSYLTFCDKVLKTRPIAPEAWDILLLKRALSLSRLRRSKEVDETIVAIHKLHVDYPTRWSRGEQWGTEVASFHQRVRLAELEAVRKAIAKRDTEEIEARLEHRRLQYELRAYMGRKKSSAAKGTGTRSGITVGCRREKFEHDFIILPNGTVRLKPLETVAALAQKCIKACRPSRKRFREYYWRGRLYEFMVDYDRAIVDYQACLKWAKDIELLGKTRFRLGVVEELLGNIKCAAKLHKANFANPKIRASWGVKGVQRVAQYFRVQARKKRKAQKLEEVAGNYAESAKYFRMIADLTPAHQLSSQNAVLAGQALILQAAATKDAKEKGKLYREAAGLLENAIKRFPDNARIIPEAMYWRGDCYYRVGDKVQAYRTWKALTWDYPETKWAKYAGSWFTQPGMIELEEKD